MVSWIAGKSVSGVIIVVVVLSVVSVIIVVGVVLVVVIVVVVIDVNDGNHPSSFSPLLLFPFPSLPPFFSPPFPLFFYNSSPLP